MAEITLAKTAGFCFGVKRAVDKAFELARSGVDAVTLGPIIHNPQVVERLAKMGVPPVDSPDQAAPGQTVLIRSHGVPKKVYNLLKNNPVVDCTCPFVAKIHRIVEEESAAGRAILVAGDPGHPEVQGIMGFSSSPVYTFRTEQELQNILNVLHENGGKPISVVAQTTFHEILWRKFQQFIENHYTNAKIFDTICSATTMRQKEAVELAQQSDYMVVVGGKSSSNTLKLYEICSRFCETALVETKSELDKSQIFRHNRIGVTAGASTPADIIKEVQTTMTEILENHDEELNFAELLEQSLNEKLYTGKRVKGIVTNVAPNELHVDVGAKQAGIVPASEISDEAVNLMEMFHKDDEIDLIVLKVNDQEGIVTLSKKRCDAEAGYDAIREAYENGTVLEGTVTEVVKGGILVTTNGIKVFIPASMTSDRKVEDLNTLLKKDVRFKVIEINDRRRRAVGSIRAVLADEKKAKQEEFWANVEIGKVYHGEVKSLTSYGAFVDLGGVDGMIHITELSWTRIKSPEEVVKVGDMVEVYIKDIDTEKKKISLGYKKAEDNPWEIFKRDYQIGDVAEVKIVSITSFGAFAQIIPGVDGLIHISQIANERIAKVSDKLAVGDVVKAKIIDIDFDKKKVSLSIREVLDEEPAEEAAEEEAPDYAADLEGVDGVTVE
ncbi:MAG TPA: bifunctional 4-hydroxy-3-methylbut-2-enyl diphosphate reductase/30S ribosomal protein S1 [Candidatus Merdivicinus excrementipullorum]|uniref:4-hydroxy-3-methylbut-2-enyl diphosphate reductase n=1 Tax=Candidatus Merdivicinus excrementipullorum TaxID=2840867 RepID=A0A9D1K0P4_9FIRM|nr:bifunctional 4-hydroxy-3-methylbut-2-enyl diphosphate reductase/30S ribosomal protein S1 [Candidatus Merdivicinus excrementipullorum]